MTRRHGGQAIPPVHTRVCPCTRPSLRASWAAPPCPIRGRAWQHSAQILVYPERAPPWGVDSCFKSEFSENRCRCCCISPCSWCRSRACSSGSTGWPRRRRNTSRRQWWPPIMLRSRRCRRCVISAPTPPRALTAQPVAPPAIAKAPAAAPAPAKTVAQAQPVIAPPPDAKVNAPPSAPAVAAAEPEAAPADVAAAEPAPEPAPKCDVRACEAAYISFRAEDCTYQPSFGAAPLVREGHAAGRAGGGPGASLGRAVLVSCASLPASLFHLHRGRLHLSAFERPAPHLHQITPRFEQS